MIIAKLNTTAAGPEDDYTNKLNDYTTNDTTEASKARYKL